MTGWKPGSSGTARIARLITEVRDDALYVRFVPFHLNYRKIRYDELKEARATLDVTLPEACAAVSAEIAQEARRRGLPVLEIEKRLGVESLGYLSLAGMEGVVKESGPFCNACFSGEYPAPLVDLDQGLIQPGDVKCC